MSLSVRRVFVISATATVAAQADASTILIRATASVSAAVSFERRRNLAASADATAVSAAASFSRDRGFSTSVVVSAVATPTLPNITNGGVTTVLLSIVAPGAGVDVPPAAMVRTAGFAAAGAASASASVTQRRARQFATTVAVLSFSTATVRRVRVLAAGASATAASAPASVLVRRDLSPAAAEVRVTASPSRLRIAAAFQVAAAATAAAAPAEIVRGRGFSVADSAVVVAAAADLQLAEKLFAAPAFATVTATPATFSTVLAWGANAVICRVTATAEMFTNLYDDEPPYRTLIVPRQPFVATIPPQAFTAFISSDARPMITYSKQPGERLAYDFEFAEWFADLEGDDIEAASVTVVSATSSAGPADVNALVVQQPIRIGAPSTRVKIWIDGGVSGVRYKLTLVIDTEGGRRKEVDFYIRIKEL